MKLKAFLIFLTIYSSLLSGQQNILESPAILEKVQDCLYATYGCHFKTASLLQQELEKELPEHPAPYFLKGLLIYWENFPLLPDDVKTNQFTRAMDQAITFSQPMIGISSTDMEGVFFDMHARAFEGMFWADNGKAARVIPDLDNMYRNTMKGIEYKTIFNEYYFSSALYNYYIEAYIDKHPVYKPIVRLFRKGNKELGLKELEYAIDSTTYIKYEAILFMSLIQLNYEQNLASAADYMAVLYNNFPDNIYFLAQYLIILMHSKNFLVASALHAKLANNKTPFHKMIYSMSEGFLQENQLKNDIAAKKNYRKCIQLAEEYGTIADLYAAIAYAGLSRIATRANDDSSARKYRRSSMQRSVYDFILDY